MSQPLSPTLDTRPGVQGGKGENPPLDHYPPLPPLSLSVCLSVCVCLCVCLSLYLGFTQLARKLLGVGQRVAGIGPNRFHALTNFITSKRGERGEC